MNKREAKRRACLDAYNLLNTGHNNEFLEEWEEKDAERMRAAWEELLSELFRRSETKEGEE